MRFRRPAWWDQPNHPVFVVTLVVLLGFVGWLVWWWLAGRDDGEGGATGRAPGGGESSESIPAVPSVKASPPPLPAEAKEKTTAGAQAFAKYYIEIDNYVLNARDLEPARKLFDPEECTRCKAVLDRYEANLKSGSYIRGGDYQVTSSSAVMLPENLSFVKVTFNREAVQSYDKNGKKNGKLVEEVRDYKVLITLKYKEDRWLVTTFDRG